MFDGQKHAEHHKIIQTPVLVAVSVWLLILSEIQLEIWAKTTSFQIILY